MEKTQKVNIDFTFDPSNISEIVDKCEIQFKNLKAATKKAASSMKEFGGLMEIPVLQELWHCLKEFFPKTVLNAYHDTMADIYRYTFVIYPPEFVGVTIHPVKWQIAITTEGLHHGMSPQMFDQYLSELCEDIDKTFKLNYPLYNKGLKVAFDAETPFEIEPTSTTSYYKYLENRGVIQAAKERLSYPKLNTDDFWFNEYGEYKYEKIKEFKPMDEVFHVKAKSQVVGTQQAYSNSGVLLANVCPGLSENVKYPCGCFLNSKDNISSVIMHLNDYNVHGETDSGSWTREQIADWLETLDVDLSFKDNGSEELEEEET